MATKREKISQQQHCSVVGFTVKLTADKVQLPGSNARAISKRNCSNASTCLMTRGPLDGISGCLVPKFCE